MLSTHGIFFKKYSRHYCLTSWRTEWFLYLFPQRLNFVLWLQIYLYISEFLFFLFLLLVTISTKTPLTGLSSILRKTLNETNTPPTVRELWNRLLVMLNRTGVWCRSTRTFPDSHRNTQNGWTVEGNGSHGLKSYCLVHRHLCFQDEEVRYVLQKTWKCYVFQRTWKCNCTDTWRNQTKWFCRWIVGCIMCAHETSYVHSHECVKSRCFDEN